MSNVDTELFELCKQVYKRTGWDDLPLSQRYDAYEGDGIEDEYIRIPAYNVEYILQRLPKPRMTLRNTSDGWTAYYDTLGEGLPQYESTPLKALLKLTIALDDAGIKL